MLEDDFKNKSKNNPPNLLRQCNYCNISQPRYKLHPNHQAAFPDHKYLAYKQCLPGCVVISRKAFNKTTIVPNKKPHNVIVLLTNDTLCVAYDVPSSNNLISNSQTPSKSAAAQLSSSNISPLILKKKDYFNEGRFLVFSIR